MAETGTGAAARIDRVVRGTFTARRKAAFLAALGESGNVRLACAAAGVSSTRAYVARRRDAAFAEGWAEALAAADARLAEERGDRGELVVRRNCKGRLARRIARVNDWTDADDLAFLAALTGTGNVTAAAGAVRKHVSRAYKRRRASPAFRAAWDEALDEAMVRLEWALVERAGAALPAPVPEAGAAAAGAGAPDAAALDPSLALALLKHHAAKKEGAARRGARARREPDMGRVRDSVLAKLAAIRRHRDEA